MFYFYYWVAASLMIFDVALLPFMFEFPILQFVLGLVSMSPIS